MHKNVTGTDHRSDRPLSSEKVVEPDRAADGRRQPEVLAGQVKPVGDVVGLAQKIHLPEELRIVERGSFFLLPEVGLCIGERP